KLHGELRRSDAPDSWSATMSAVAVGYPDYQLRESAHEAEGHRGSLPLLAARFRPVAGSFSLEEQSATAVGALEEDFSWRAEGACVGISSPFPHDDGVGSGVS